jgi:hypothetical protein
MPSDSDFKRRIEANLLSFSDADLKDSAVELFKTLGYKSDKTLSIAPKYCGGLQEVS